MNNTPDPIRDILNEFRQSSIIIHAKGSVLGVDEDVRAFETSITDAETAINAYILGEVMELINSCYDKDYGIDSVALRNKANKKFGVQK